MGPQEGSSLPDTHECGVAVLHGVLRSSSREMPCPDNDVFVVSLTNAFSTFLPTAVFRMRSVPLNMNRVHR